jgi:hypothetical protein
VEATYVGHDLTRGTTSFAKSSRPERGDVEEDGDPVVKQLLHAEADLPQLDSQGRTRTGGGDSRVA